MVDHYVGPVEHAVLRRRSAGRDHPGSGLAATGPRDDGAGLVLALLVGCAAVNAIVVAIREAPGSDEMDPGAGDARPTATGRLTDG